MPEAAVFNKRYKPKSLSSIFSESGTCNTTIRKPIVIKVGVIGAGRINILQLLAEEKK